MDNYISKKLYSKKEVSIIDKKIKLLGQSSKMDCYKFLNIRFFGMIILFILTFILNKFGYLLAPIISIIYYKGITYILLDSRINLRQKRLEKEALNFFEILTLSLETGRNLTEALNVTLSSTEGELANEFREVLREVKYGKSLTEALNEVEANIPSDTINNIVLSLTQANLYGSSIINSLYNQIDYLREKRKLEVKATISKVPIKISIISVLFFVPLILLIILAPVVLEYFG